MSYFVRKGKKRKEGFTLIELVIVVAITGILMAIAIPNYMSARVTAAQNATKANLYNLVNALEFYAVEKDKATYPTSVTGTDGAATWLSIYIRKAPVPPGGGSYKYIGGADGTTFTIYDPNGYEGKYYSIGPGGVITESTTAPSGGTALTW